MNQNPVNVTLLLFVIVCLALGFLLSRSPEVLERVGRRFRARSRGLIAAREAFWMASSQSLDDDARTDQDRKELRRLFVEELSKSRDAA